MYTSGCPKNQNRFSNRYELPPPAGMKKLVPIVRSSAAISRVAISVGAASTIRIEVANVAHTKIGSRDHVSPGARIVMMVAIMFRPSRVIDTPTRAKKMM